MRTKTAFPPFLDALAECQDIINDYLVDDHYIDGGNVLNSRGEIFFSAFLEAINWQAVCANYDGDRKSLTKLILEHQIDGKLDALLSQSKKDTILASQPNEFGTAYQEGNKIMKPTAKIHRSFRLQPDNARWIIEQATKRDLGEGSIVDELVELHRPGTIPFLIRKILSILENKK